MACQAFSWRRPQTLSLVSRSLKTAHFPVIEVISIAGFLRYRWCQQRRILLVKIGKRWSAVISEPVAMNPARG